MADIKIATVQPIGILDEASLEPANQSSGSATAGQVLTADGAGGASWSSEIEIAQGLGVWGATPPASQPLKISDPAGGATVDTEARTAINALIDALEGAGITSAT